MTKEELEQAKLTYSRLFEERGRQIKSIAEPKYNKINFVIKYYYGIQHRTRTDCDFGIRPEHSSDDTPPFKH